MPDAVPNPGEQDPARLRPDPVGNTAALLRRDVGIELPGKDERRHGRVVRHLGLRSRCRPRRADTRRQQSKVEWARVRHRRLAPARTVAALHGDKRALVAGPLRTLRQGGEVPDALFDQLADGGRLLVPVELRGGGCQVTVLHREGSGFMAERAVPGWFVPLLGSRQQRPQLRLALAELPFWDEIKGAPSRRVKLPLASGPDGMAGSAVTAFRAFLGRTAPGFAVFGEGEPPEQRPGVPAEPFGIVDAADRSVALWRDGELVGCGGPGAMRSAARAYANWVACGLPGLAEMGLQVLRAGAVPAADGRAWVETRSGTVLVWRPLSGAEDWKDLLGGDA